MKRHNAKRPYENHAGFTLVEVLIAMAILAIGIMAVFSLEINATKNNTAGNLLTQATLLAQSKLETMKNIQDMTTLSSGSESGIDADGNSGGIFDRTWTVQNPLGGNSTRLVAVSVQWQRWGRTRGVTLQALSEGNGL